MTRYTAISLWQPWASLILAGVKAHETRHWAAPKTQVGQRVLIHAAGTVQGYLGVDAQLQAICVRHFGEAWRDTLPRGVFLGFVILGAPKRTDEIDPRDHVDALCGDWSDGRWAWPLYAPSPFPEPIPGKGQQKFWSVELDLTGEIPLSRPRQPPVGTPCG